MDRMTGANMNLVTINVKLGENDNEPEQKLEPASFNAPYRYRSRTSLIVG